MMKRLYASLHDAFAAGMEAFWIVRDRTEVVSHAAYTGSRGGFNPTPGTAGLHLNGFGELNRNLFCTKAILAAKKGTSLKCSGKGGKLVVYNNPNLSQHEYEDNVTIDGVNLGRCYGRQTY